MSTDQKDKRGVGSLLQAYARAKKMDGAGQSAEVVRLSGMLGRELMQRVDTLGFDADRLLEVAPDAALETLETLESATVAEDASAGTRGAGSRPAARNGRPVLRRREASRRGRW